MHSPLKLIKIGGNVIDNPEALDRFIDEFVAIDGRKILVHGGGKIATKLAVRLNVETKMIDGRRVTNKEMLDIAVMTYAGLINKRIVAALNAKGCKAIGLCGADASIITSRRRSHIPVDYGEVGDIVNVDAPMLLSIINAGLTPIICAITASKDGNLLNTNADSVATSVAMAVSELTDTSLIFCFEKNGILKDINDESSLIELITPTMAGHLIEQGIINGGMVPKIMNAVNAVTNSSLLSVTIRNSSNLDINTGTTVTK